MKKIILSILLTAVFLAGASCSEKEGSGVGGSKPMAADYFSYTLSKDGKAVEITGFSNKMKEEFYDKKGEMWNLTVLHYPGKIEGLPVKSITVTEPLRKGNPEAKSLEDAFIPYDAVIIPDNVETVYIKGPMVQGGNLSILCAKKIIPGKNAKYKAYQDDEWLNTYFFFCLEEFTVPQSAEHLGLYTACTFTEVKIPSHIKFIGTEGPGDRGFAGCPNLKEIIIPDGVKIGVHATFKALALSVKTQQRLRELGYKGSF